MSDFNARHPHDTVTIPAALVMPDDTPPYMGPDTARVPVRIVWHTPNSLPPVATGGGPATALRGQATNARMGTNPNADDPPPDAPGAPAPEWSTSGDGSRANPVASFLKVNEALDRITGAAAPKTRGAAVAGTSAPVSVVDDGDSAIRDTRSPESFDRSASEDVG
jgi:hypothetical protein